ncbi:MAG: iron transporter FeoB [Methanolinea sp. SDB]|nr:MAG: iron transporter FeoB [Methanolinea sp. SDB]
MKKIVLMGNPNVGKSVVFSRLTGARVISSNYPGSTVDFAKGRMHIRGHEAEIIDAPGTYSLQASNKAEEVAARVLDQADLVINVVDATNLERNLFLTLELIETGKPVVVALNIWDEAVRSGIEIDYPALEEELGVPVIPVVALSGEGIRELVQRMDEVSSSPARPPVSDEEKWIRIGSVTREIQTIRHRHPTLRDRISLASIVPITGVPIAIGVILLAFFTVRIIGETMIQFIFDPIFDLYLPFVTALGNWLGPGILQEVLIGRLIDGEIDYVQSLGILTTGLYVPLGMVLPYIISFYFTLSILEDSGYLPRLATLADSVFHRLGMHGYGIVPLFLGMGCNVPGALATRCLDTRKQRFISATLLAIAVPCMAQLAMIFGVLGPFGLMYILMVIATLFIVYIAGGLVLARFVKGESYEICLEIPPYRMPDPGIIAKKTWMRVRGFLGEAIPYLFAGILLVNILYATGFLDWIGNLFAPVTAGLFGLPKEATTALLMGFLRKDLAVGMLIPLGMAPLQLVIAVTVLTIYFPCVATFAVLVRELGSIDMLKSTAVMVATALIVGTAMRVILLGV